MDELLKSGMLATATVGASRHHPDLGVTPCRMRVRATTHPQGAPAAQGWAARQAADTVAPMNTPTSADPAASMAEIPYGAMAHVMKDHLYILERGHLFTTPCMAARLSLRFYVTVALSANGSAIEIDSGSDLRHAPAMVFRPSHPRVVRTRDAQLVAALVNPLHPAFPRFRAIAGTGIATLDAKAFASLADELARAYRGELDIGGAIALHEKIVACAAAAMPAIAPIDERVQRAAERARADPMLSTKSLAQELGLSPSRLSHLFTGQMGLPLRAYQLWAKVHRTATLLASGMSLSHITQDAGFADQAHMRRVFHDLFGAPPSHFLRNPDVVMRLGRV